MGRNGNYACLDFRHLAAFSILCAAGQQLDFVVVCNEFFDGRSFVCGVQFGGKSVLQRSGSLHYGAGRLLCAGLCSV